MAVDILYNVTSDEIKDTNMYSKGSNLIKDIITSDYFINRLNEWLTVAHYKGLDYMCNVHHMNEWKVGLLKHFFKNK